MKKTLIRTLHLRKMVLSAILLALMCCKTASQHESTVQNLKQSYVVKDEVEFLKQFPKDFQQFQSYFGWDRENDVPQKLYNEASIYIDYWFSVIAKHKKHEKDIIDVCTDGNWEPDAVNYLQDKTIAYIKENKKYSLINELGNDKAQSVLFFLFDGPHPEFDPNFESNLTAPKKVLLKKLFETGFFDANENPDVPEVENAPIVYNISDFEDNEHYFIRSIDVNNDEIADKVVSADPYQGDELLLFVNKKGNYEFALKTVNFSQDGGNQIHDIIKNKTGFTVITAFPDRGFFEAHHNITFKNGNWVLTHTLYKTTSGNEEDAFIYVCKVAQNINLKNDSWFDKLKSIPAEKARDNLCIKEKI